MKFKDLVANSLPRVRGRKSKKSTHAHSSTHVSAKQETDFQTYPPRFMQPHAVFDSRESSVERSSTVAVVDAPWRENAAYNRGRPSDLGLLTQSVTYYKPSSHQQHGMVMSHSADGISAQAMMLTSPRGYVNGSKFTTLSDHYTSTGHQHPNVTAISESAVDYVGPNCIYHSQHQHQHQHHHHHHSHDYHYVYHHQHYQGQTRPPNPLGKTAPLTERNYHPPTNATNTNTNNPASEKSRKAEPAGFFRKSFASFRAMRKQASRNKEKDNRQNEPMDENDKCLVCPYPQSQIVDKNGSHKKPSKQSKKEFKSFMKSKKSKQHSSSTQDNQNDVSWYSDKDSKMIHRSHHACNLESTPYGAWNQFPVRECSMETSISRQNGAGSRDAMDQQHLETASLSGYDSDVTKNKTSRSRSRIKTNPWLPSPQPSLTMGRRVDNKCRSRDFNDDSMEDDNPGCFPRSASFDYHSQLGVSSFLSSGQSEPKRNIQRHRSLTPVDLKLNLNLPRTKKTEQSHPSQKKNHLNDLNTKLTKSSRPNSIISPNTEFIALADNIEQLANNISFEYEDNFNASLGSSQAFGMVGSTPNGDKSCSVEETLSKKRKSDSSPLPNENISDNAHSPDSGIGCLGSCDGDDAMTMVNTVMLEQSPTVSIPSRDSNKSDSFNSTPKRKTTKNNDSSYKSSEGKFDNKREWVSPGRNKLTSGSVESIHSAAVSESDIDNTSYKYVESNCTSDVIVSDSQNPKNLNGYLMVDERLDVNFRSLPRKVNGKHAKVCVESCRSHTIDRCKNKPEEYVCESLSLNSFPNKEMSALSLTRVQNPSDNSNEINLHLSNVKENFEETELKGEYIQYGLNRAIGRECDDSKWECKMTMNCVELDPNYNKYHHPYEFKHQSETFEAVTMDTVDASVQTDFYDSWERGQPLSPLDDSFDPVESTRRWLISGNMQGSADTGYSSQPRDSQVFMEEEVSLLQFDGLSDHCKGKLKAVDGDPVYNVNNSSINIYRKQHKMDNQPNGEANEEQIVVNDPSSSESNKRHSSDSSTSTLTSDVAVLENDNLLSLSPPCQHDSLHNRKTNFEDHDYVNLPVRHFRDNPHSQFSSTDSNKITTFNDGRVPIDSNNKCQLHTKCVKCSSSCQQNGPVLLSQTNPSNSEESKRQSTDDRINSKVDPSRYLEETPNFAVDKADYLEFLRDAPLQPSNHIFIIPGFGPLEFPMAIFDPEQKGIICCLNNSSFFNKGQVKTEANSKRNMLPTQLNGSVVSADGLSRSNNNKATIKPKKEDRSIKSKFSSHNSHNTYYNKLYDTPQMVCVENTKKDTKAAPAASLHSGKRKQYKESSKTDRCPTVRSYDVDDFAHDADNKPNMSFSIKPEALPQQDKSGSTRNLAERVSLLRREKEIIYRKIQEVQQQELHRQREQLQQHRSLHSQRKEELLETLRDLKEKLEEQSKKLQVKCREEV